MQCVREDTRHLLRFHCRDRPTRDTYELQEPAEVLRFHGDAAFYRRAVAVNPHRLPDLLRVA